MHICSYDAYFIISAFPLQLKHQSKIPRTAKKELPAGSSFGRLRGRKLPLPVLLSHRQRADCEQHGEADTGEDGRFVVVARKISK